MDLHCIVVRRLEEAEEKYRSRQSRPEDLEFIEQLKRALAERELDMKKLVVGADLFSLTQISDTSLNLTHLL